MHTEFLAFPPPIILSYMLGIEFSKYGMASPPEYTEINNARELPDLLAF